jgi:DNA adenine methylase
MIDYSTFLAAKEVSVAHPAIRYYGGKWRLAPWIIEQFPVHDCYVEPFAGACSVLLQKRPSGVEVANDLNGEVVNFFTVLRTQESELIRAIELTPFSREEVATAYQPIADPLEAARRFYVRSWQGRGAPTAQWNTGWRYVRKSNNTAIDQWNRVDHLWAVAARLKAVHFEHDDARTTIARYDGADALFYCDPPYPHSTRSMWRLSSYGEAHEMTDDDHRALAQQLHGVKGMVAISGYPCELYDELYADWHKQTCTTGTQNGGKQATECLWLSPAASRGERQMTMFEGAPS